MNDTCDFIGLTLRGKTAGLIALGLRSLLLFLDGGDLDSTCGDSHCSRDGRENIAYNGDCGGRTVGVQGVGRGLRHGLYYLHREHLAVGLLLRLGDFLFLVFFELLDLVGVTLGTGDLRIIPLVYLGGLYVKFGLHERRELREYSRHTRNERVESTRQRLASVTVEPFHGIGDAAFHGVAGIFLGKKSVLLFQGEFRLLVCLVDAEFFFRIAFGGGKFTLIHDIEQSEVGVVLCLSLLWIVAEVVLLHGGILGFELFPFLLLALHLRDQQGL